MAITKNSLLCTLVFIKPPVPSCLPSDHLIPFPSNLSGIKDVFEENVFSGSPGSPFGPSSGSSSAPAPAQAPAADIATEAGATTVLLDRAASQIHTGAQARGAPASLLKYDGDLARIRQLVQKIRFQGDLQTPAVETALAKLKVVANQLALISGGGPGSLASQKLTNAMDEVVQAAENLRQQLPGDVSTAFENEVKGGFQNNAAIGGARPDGRVISEARGNKSTDATQVNAPMYGNPNDLAAFMMAVQSVGGSRR